MRRADRRRKVQSLRGPWAAGVDAAQAEIEIATLLAVPGDSEIEAWTERPTYPWAAPPRFTTLLGSREEELVTRISFANGSRILVVPNGSFLLNLPLVNHQHRKLAGKLITACAPPGHIVFLESGPDGPKVLDTDPDASYPTGLEIFTVWPLNVIMLHLTFVGILLLIALFPIFGPAYPLSRSSPSDFGKHIIAFGELLERTRDRQFAIDRVRYYYEHVRRDSGLSYRREAREASTVSTDAPRSTALGSGQDSSTEIRAETSEIGEEHG